jgi:hypothetical protein
MGISISNQLLGSTGLSVGRGLSRGGGLYFAGFGGATPPFTPASLFASGAPGFLLDATLADLSSLYQDSAGTIPVTNVEQPVGLVLDTSQGLALGSNLVTNGTFDTNTTGWTAIGGGTLASVGGELLVTNTAGNYGGASQLITCVIGKRYVVSCTARIGTTPLAYLLVRAGSATGTTIVSATTSSSTNVTLNIAFNATNTSMFVVLGNDTGLGATAFYDTVTFQEVAGNHFVQSTSAARPVLSARVNLLTKTEQFNDAAWVKSASPPTVTANTTTAPDGTTTADTIASAGGSSQFAYQDVAVTVGTTVKYSFYILKTTSTTNGLYGGFSVEFRTASTAVAEYGANIDSDTGALITPSGWGTAGFSTTSIVSAGNFWLITVTTPAAPATTTLARIYHGVAGYFLNGTRLGSGSSSKVLWGADLRVANDTASPVYQRVNTATDYATTGFPLYLRYDGVDDFMSSPLALSTLGLTVWFGFRKTGNVGVSSRYFFMGDTTGSVNNLGALQNAIGYRWPENTNVPLGSDDISTRLVSYQRASTTSQTANLNGIAVSPNTSLTTTFTSATSRLGCNIVSGVNDLFFNGRIYFPLVVLGRTATATEITNMESYLSASMGGGYVPTGYDFLVTGDGDQLTDASGNALYTIPLYS